MKKILRSLVFASVLAFGLQACKSVKPAYSSMSSGLEYKMIRDMAGTVKPAVGDHMEIHIKSQVRLPTGDTVLYDSRIKNAGMPVPYTLMPPSFKGDISEGLMLLTEGDIAEFRIPVDSMLKHGNKPYHWMQPGKNQKIVYNVVVVTIKPKAGVGNKAGEAGPRQKEDEQLIRDYLKSRNIQAERTPSGLFYKIDKQGSGPRPGAGDNVSVNYTGATLNGTKFDSNVDPQFNHVAPLKFTLGIGQVIKGWDEGIALMPKGSKGTLYIPSDLAYGSRSPTPLIPAHSVLVFDVEVVDHYPKQ